MPHTILVRDRQVQVDGEDAAQVILKAIKDADDRLAALDAQIKSLNADLDTARAATNTANATVASKDKEIGDLKVVVAAKDSEIDGLKQQVTDAALSPQKLDLIVKERAEIIDKSKRILGDRLVVEGKTNAEIMRQVVDSRMAAAAKGYSDDHVRVAFDTITVTGPTHDALSDALTRRRMSPAYSLDAREDAHDRRVKQLQDAWKNPTGVQQRQ